MCKCACSQTFANSGTFHSVFGLIVTCKGKDAGRMSKVHIHFKLVKRSQRRLIGMFKAYSRCLFYDCLK